MSYLRKDRKVIIFSGFNQRGVVSFLRTLEKLKIPYGIITLPSSEDPIYYSKYRERVVWERPTRELDLPQFIEAIKGARKSLGNGEFFLVPSSEALNRFFLRYRGEFESLGCVIPLVEKELYERISDKFSFGEICSSSGILVPPLKEKTKLEEFPVVAKPKRNFSCDGKRSLYPVIIHDEKSLREFLLREDENEYYFQDFIGGKSFYLLYYFSRNGVVKKFSQENLIQQPGGKSIIAAVSSTIHRSKYSEKFESLFQRLGFRGLVMVELKGNDKGLYMIEANPRVWGPSQLFIDGGVNLFIEFLKDWGFDCENEGEEREARYFWFGGLIEVIKRRERVVFHRYNKELLAEEFNMWLEWDVYRRKDTLGIFCQEIGL